MGGSGQISECMARELGDQVVLQSPVCSIDQSGVLVAVETLDKRTYMVSELELGLVFITQRVPMLLRPSNHHSGMALQCS